jgi:hypothetical protein
MVLASSVGNASWRGMHYFNPAFDVHQCGLQSMWFAAGKRKGVATRVFSYVDAQRFAVTSSFLDQLFRYVVMMNIDSLVVHASFSYQPQRQ